MTGARRSRLGLVARHPRCALFSQRVGFVNSHFNLTHFVPSRIDPPELGLASPSCCLLSIDHAERVALRFSLRRYDSPWMLITVERCSSRSSAAEAMMASSAKT